VKLQQNPGKFDVSFSSFPPPFLLCQGCISSLGSHPPVLSGPRQDRDQWNLQSQAQLPSRPHWPSLGDL
jgi:hypothetical protein